MESPASPARSRPGALRSLWLHRDLVRQLGHREIIGKYKGSFLGLLWSFFHPLVMLAIYTFVFTTVFKARWIEGETTAGFATALFVGLIMHGFLSDCLARATGLVLGNPSYVTKVVFPLEILPFPSAIAALFHLLCSLGVLLLAKLLLDGAVPWTAILFPIVLFPLVIQAIAWSWVLAALAVYVRDVAQTVSLLITALLFLSPVFYPLETLPQGLRDIARINPLTIPMEEARNVLLWGRMPDWSQLGIYTLVSLLIAWLAYRMFEKARKGFADVL